MQKPVITRSLFVAGNRGNKNEEAVPAGLFFGLTLISIVCYLFYTLWQTYVLTLDVAINAVSLGFLSAQAILGVLLLVALRG
jgi:hypothetical protein